MIEQPLVNVAAINARLDGVEELVGDSVARADTAPRSQRYLTSSA
ncbi:MAG: hypothetical protein ACLRZH_00115 [Ruthenibacterium lactatiformans]